MKKGILFFRLIANIIDLIAILLTYIVFFYIMNINTKKDSVLLMLIVNFVVEIAFWKNSTTLGKHLLSLKVVDKFSYEDIGMIRMIIRENIGKIVSNIFFLGYIYAIFDKDNQTFHDKLVNSIVIDK